MYVIFWDSLYYGKSNWVGVPEDAHFFAEQEDAEYFIKKNFFVNCKVIKLRDDIIHKLKLGANANP